MTDVSIPFTEDEIAAAPEALSFIISIFDDAQHMIDYPDAYNKAEVVAKLELITGLMREALEAGATVIQGTIEIDQMIRDPNV